VYNIYIISYQYQIAIVLLFYTIVLFYYFSHFIEFLPIFAFLPYFSQYIATLHLNESHSLTINSYTTRHRDVCDLETLRSPVVS